MDTMKNTYTMNGHNEKYKTTGYLGVAVSSDGMKDNLKYFRCSCFKFQWSEEIRNTQTSWNNSFHSFDRAICIYFSFYAAKKLHLYDVTFYVQEKIQTKFCAQLQWRSWSPAFCHCSLVCWVHQVRRVLKKHHINVELTWAIMHWPFALRLVTLREAMVPSPTAHTKWAEANEQWNKLGVREQSSGF